MPAHCDTARPALNSFLVAIGTTLHPALAAAQVVTDGTVGPAARLSGPDFAVGAELGTRRGGNLFHSFERFDLVAGESATFSGPAEVTNVLARITGGSPSSIDGTVRNTIPDADTYLINPSGIVFGPNARLDVQGAFAATTADEIAFPDGGRYSASRPDDSVLSVAPPEAFGFLGDGAGSILLDRSDLTLRRGADLSIVSGGITIRGPGGEIADVDPFDNDSRRTVRNKITLPGGDLSLVSVATLGDVAIAPEIDAEGFDVYGPILLSDTYVDLGGEAGGGLLIRGGDVRIGADFLLRADRFDIVAGRQKVRGAGGGFFQTPTIIDAASLGEGRGGVVLLEAAMITFIDGVSVLTESLGSGDAGEMTIVADSVSLLPTAAVGSEVFGAGDSGDLRVTAGHIFVDDGNAPVIRASLPTASARALLATPVPSWYRRTRSISSTTA